MDHSVLVEITPKGKENIQHSLGRILGTLGINPEEGIYGESQNTFQEPMDLSKVLTPDTLKIYDQVKKFFKEYFLLSIQSPRPQILIGPSSHLAQFKKISLLLSDKNQSPYNTNELLIQLDLELENLQWMSSYILITDLNNPVFNVSFVPAQNLSEKQKLDQICAKLNTHTNPKQCGIIEFRDIHLKLVKKGENLKVSIPLKVSQLPTGKLKFSTLTVKHNIQKLQVHRKYSGFNFFIDELPIGSGVFKFQKSKLKEVFDGYEESLIQFFKTTVAEFLETDLASQLDKKYEDFITRHSETISERAPPGRKEFGCTSPSTEQIQACKETLQLLTDQDPKNLSRQYRFCLSADFNDVQMTLQMMKNNQFGYCPGFICPNYIEGLKISKLHFGPSALIDIAAFIEDPLFQHDSVEDKMAMNPLHAASKFSNPEFNGLPKSNYDVALAVNRGFFNRLLQLSWNRGYLKIIKGLESNLKLVSPPVINSNSLSQYVSTNPLEAPFRIRLEIDYKIKNSKKDWTPEEEREYQSFKDYIKERSFKKDSFILSFDVLAKLNSRNNLIYITPFSIDTESARFDQSQLTWIGRQLRYRILNEVRAELEKQSKTFSKEALPFPIPLPPEIWGIRFDTKKIEIDSKGFLVLYLNYNHNSSKTPNSKGVRECSE